MLLTIIALSGRCCADDPFTNYLLTHWLWNGWNTWHSISQSVCPSSGLLKMLSTNFDVVNKKHINITFYDKEIVIET